MPPGRIHYLAHARERMAERSITEDEIEYALNQPGAAYPSKMPGRSIAEKKLRPGAVLKVVYE